MARTNEAFFSEQQVAERAKAERDELAELQVRAVAAKRHATDEVGSFCGASLLALNPV